MLFDLLDNPLIEEESANLSERIPKIIHLVCKYKKVSEEYQVFYRQLVSLHPNWKIIIYDDSDALEIVKTQFPELLSIYKSYSRNIQRVDIFRIIIVYLRGGFYLDMDMYCLKSLNDLCHFGLVLGEERTYNEEEIKLYNINRVTMQLANYMFGSIPNHPFWIEVLKEAIKRSNTAIQKENDILFTTGPWLLSEVYDTKSKQYDDLTVIRNKFRLCLKYCNSISCRFGEYAVHFHTGTWRWKNSEEFIDETPPEKSLLTDKQIADAYQAISGRFIS